MNDQTTENTLQQRGIVSQRITPADIEAAIVKEHYFSAADGVTRYTGEDATAQGRLSLLTICVLELRNGMTIVGTSACADPATFQIDMGQKIARQKATDQVWPLLGYELLTKLANRPPLQSLHHLPPTPELEKPADRGEVLSTDAVSAISDMEAQYKTADHGTTGQKEPDPA